MQPLQQVATWPRPWQDAWQDALYGPAGFYRHQAPAQHFATSAQGIPGGDRILAEAVVALARRHGCSRVVEVAAGRGELLVQLRRLAPDLRLTGLDVVPAPAGLPVQEWIRSPGGAALPEELIDLEDTLLLAHEWLDVLPCPVVERDLDHGGPGVWRTVLVDVDGTESLGDPLVDLTGHSPDSGDVATRADVAWLAAHVGPGVRRAEIGRPRDRAWADLVSRVRSGVVVAVDYGHEAHTRPLHGSLTGFRGGQQVDPVPDGSCDLTAHVAMDSLLAATPSGQAGGDPESEPAIMLTQREALTDLLTTSASVGGLDDSHPGSLVPHELARTDPTAYLTRLARRAAWQTLTAPGGLGDFRWVLAARR